MRLQCKCLAACVCHTSLANLSWSFSLGLLKVRMLNERSAGGKPLA